MKADFESFSYKKRKETEVIAEYFLKENQEYMVNLKLVENEESLFSIYISVTSSEEAESMCDKWKNDTESLYKNILKLFM